MNTLFLLFAEFDTAEIPLEKVCKKYFGLEPDEAKRRASMNRLPIPAYRGGSQKSPWLVSADVLARYLDEKKTNASKSWQQSQVA